MAVNYTFQTNAALTQISPTLIQSATLDDPIFKLFPIRQRNASRLRWSIQDNYKGLMKLRGLGGEPTSIQRVATNVYEEIPGVYGEFATIDEIEMVTRAAAAAQVAAGANLESRVNVSDLIAESQEHLTIRQAERMKQICWTLAITGAFQVALPTGGIGHSGTYNAQTVTVSPLWSTTATATPLKNLRDLQPDFGRGTSNNFGSAATAWGNSRTLNYLLGNTNAADYGGKRVAYGNTINSVSEFNRVLLEQNAPQLATWDGGYLDDAGTFQMSIPDGKILVVGKRPNDEAPGEFQMTYNAVNGTSAPYSHTDDRANPGPRQTIPPRIDVHQGFNGGPVLLRPSQLIVLTVA